MWMASTPSDRALGVTAGYIVHRHISVRGFWFSFLKKGGPTTGLQVCVHMPAIQFFLHLITCASSGHVPVEMTKGYITQR